MTHLNFNEDLYIEETKTHGKSIFALRPFKKEEIVFTVNGPIIKVPTIYTIPISSKLFIDPLTPGRYLCHSCNPSCGVRNRTQIVARRDIDIGQEINIDYAMIVSRFLTEMTKENRVCHCDSSRCRGKLGCYDELPDELKLEYRSFISEYLLE